MTGTDLEPTLVRLLIDRPRGVLTTIKRDGRPQLSVVGHHYDEARLTLHVSVTDGRAKTRNLRRDPRASYFVGTASGSGYVVAEGTASLSEVTTAVDDATADALVGLYRSLAGEHPDWDEYRAAMVAERRLVLALPVDRVYGWVQPG